MVASGRSATLERPGLEDIHMDIEIDRGRHLEQEKREKRTGGTASDDGDS
jgi:hypothetical protein